jgi:integrase
MKLNELVTQYVSYRKSLGEKFRTNATYLKAFVKALGTERQIHQISEADMMTFLYGPNDTQITSAWFIKHAAVLGFYQYAFTRGYINQIPLPKVLPKRPPPFVPYIYSKEELRKLLDATSYYQKNKSFVEPHMVRVILLLLYSTGLRVHEALSLKLIDIDLMQNIITVRSSKFYKSRLVPISDQLKQLFQQYLLWRAAHKLSADIDAPLFIGKHNLSLNINTMRNIFQRIRAKAGITRSDHASYQPRLHDLRHTFAVHRLMNWYQENKDITKLLPILSTYMGHSHMAHTTVYLPMTVDLLNEASMRFEKYSRGDQV